MINFTLQPTYDTLHFASGTGYIAPQDTVFRFGLPPMLPDTYQVQNASRHDLTMESFDPTYSPNSTASRTPSYGFSSRSASSGSSQNSSRAVSEKLVTPERFSPFAHNNKASRPSSPVASPGKATLKPETVSPSLPWKTAKEKSRHYLNYEKRLLGQWGGSQKQRPHYTNYILDYYQEDHTLPQSESPSAKQVEQWRLRDDKAILNAEKWIAPSKWKSQFIEFYDEARQGKPNNNISHFIGEFNKLFQLKSSEQVLLKSTAKKLLTRL